MEKIYKMVARFTKDIVGIDIPDKPTILSDDRSKFRMNHLREELQETETAIYANDLGGTIDGLLDLVYVALGTMLEMGVAPGAAFEEVHTANMAKKQGALSKRPGSFGHDAIKPEGWKPPDLTPYLTATRQDILNLTKSKRHTKLSKRPIPKLVILGYAGHGKDTVCEILREVYNFRFTSTSLFCAEHVVFPILRHTYGYKNYQECYADRINHRSEWFECIEDFNRKDFTTLGRLIFTHNDIYCGLRNIKELYALKASRECSYSIWVDRLEYVCAENRNSCTINHYMADFRLDNNGTLEDLKKNLCGLIERSIL